MKRIVAVFAAAVATAVCPVAAPAQTSAPARSYRIIVNADNPVGLLSAYDLQRLFLRKTVAWSHNQQAVEPVDQAWSSPVREAFAREILKKDAASLSSYWQGMIFAGKATPPPAETSDSDVIAYVQQHPNAIGYVSAGASLPADIKPVTILRD
jgi:ABC-type phosphate transport system substrate-binding protein